MLFEIHITGDINIIGWCEKHGYKHLSLALLKPDGTILRNEFMTSLVYDFDNYPKCKEYTLNLAKRIRLSGINVIRTKIESPVIEKLKTQSLYIETHFPIAGFIDDLEAKQILSTYPASLNINKNKYIGTKREYDYFKYDNFWAENTGRELELCLYDDYVREDEDWLSLWNKD
jgi:hypothetical protein